MKIEYRGNEKKRFTINIKNKIWPTIKKIYLDENKFVVGGRRGQIYSVNDIGWVNTAFCKLL